MAKGRISIQFSFTLSGVTYHRDIALSAAHTTWPQLIANIAQYGGYDGDGTPVIAFSGITFSKSTLGK